MIDLQTVKDSYREKEIHSVAFILSGHNSADPFTKVNENI